MYPLLVLCFCLFFKISISEKINPDVDDTEGKRDSQSAINIQHLYETLLNNLKTDIQNKLKIASGRPENVCSTPHTGSDNKTEISFSATGGFKQKAGELYVSMLNYLNNKMVSWINEEREPETTDEAYLSSLGVTSNIQPSQRTDRDKENGNILYDIIANVLNKQIMDWATIQIPPNEWSQLKVSGGQNTRAPLTIFNVETKVISNVLDALKGTVLGLLSFDSDLDGPSSTTTVYFDDRAKKKFCNAFKDLELKLNTLASNDGTLKQPVSPFPLGFDDLGSLSTLPHPVDFKEMADDLLDMIEKEVKKQALAEMSAQRSPHVPSSSGIVIELFDTSKTLKEAITNFGSIYTKLLDDIFKGNFTLNDIQIRFITPNKTVESLVGSINFTQGILVLKINSDILNEPISVVVNKSNIAINYVFEIQVEVLKYHYLVGTTTGQSKGYFKASVRHVKMDGLLVVRKKEDGTCTYESLGLNLRTPDVNDYTASFVTEQGLKSNYIGNGENIINTFIVRYLLKHTMELPIIYNTLEQVNKKIILQAAEEFRKKMKKELCDCNNKD